MVIALIEIIHLMARLIIIVVLIDVVLGYFMSPYHPFKQSLDRLIEPLLSPIRHKVPSVGMFDFSPVILIILVQLVDVILTNLLSYLR
jgi:YggT family protein